MRKMSLFALLMLLVLATAVFAQASPGSPGAPGIGDPLYPGFGNGGYDVQHYTLDLTADPKSGSLSGDVSLDVQATQDLSSFNLDLIGFDIRAITVNGTDAAFSRDGQELTITPAQPIASGAAFTVEVRYKGVPDNVTSVALPVQTGWVPYNDSSNCPCSFVLSEPDGAADFFPANDHPLDKATYTLRVTVPKPYQVALNGVLKQIIDNGSTTTTVSEVSAPMASYLVTIDISQFDLVTDSGSALSAGGVPIRNYFEVGVDDATRHLFDRQPDMISYFETLFGKYPFDVYGSVMLNTETGGALEAQTLSIFGTDTVSTDYSDSEVTIAHELAHQWFGDSVSVADWRDIWLNESFATYAEGLWIEHSENAAALDAWVQDNYDYVAGDDTIVPPGSPNADDLFNDGVYYRGALALHALRLRVGDDPFFRILQTWASRYQYSNATTADFIALATEISGMDLSQFFQDWLYGVELPPIPEMNLGT